MPFSKYGCTYDEWMGLKEPKELEFLVCPNRAFSQRIPKELEQVCRKNIRFGDKYENCKLFDCKKVCWIIYKNLKDVDNVTD